MNSLSEEATTNINSLQRDKNDNTFLGVWN